MSASLLMCVACRTPVAQPWHALCRECYAWSIAGAHLARYSALMKLIREVRV